MKIEQQHIELIRFKFAAMQTKDDLVALLNIAKEIQYGEERNPICLKSLTYYADSKLAKKRYVEFSVKKKTGGVRKINVPVVGLKSILRALNLVLQCIYEPHQAANGFICNKSIVDNAKAHVGSKYVYNLDLKDFFHSFDRKMVRYGFYCAPFNMKNENLCFFGFQECPTQNRCAMHDKWGEVRNKTLEILKTTTLLDLKQENNLTNLSLKLNTNS